MEELTYTKAQMELDEILKEIDCENVDIDNLSIKIKRACELLKFCDEKLKSTDEEVKKVLSEFEKTTKLNNDEIITESSDDDNPF